MDEDALSDLFSGLGPVSIRRLFGGKGIYHQGVIIGIELRGELLLKADALLASEFEGAGCKQWAYNHAKNGKRVAMPYWSVPDGAMDSADDMAVWARKSYEAGRRSEKPQ